MDLSATPGNVDAMQPAFAIFFLACTPPRPVGVDLTGMQVLGTRICFGQLTSEATSSCHFKDGLQANNVRQGHVEFDA